VSNRGDLIDVDFTSIHSAIAAASSGDTIMLYPSKSSYGSISVSKSIHLVGMGYRLDTISQPTLEYYTDFPERYETQIGVQIEDGAQGGSINNMALSSLSVNDGAEDFVFRGVHVNRTTIISGAEDIKFSGCYFTSEDGYSEAFRFPTSNARNIIITNSILDAGWSMTNRNQIGGSTAGCLIKNCYIGGYGSISNALYLNNVAKSIHRGRNSVAYNNVILGGSTANSDGNLFGLNYDEVFGEVADRSFDLRYTLAPNSPAKGAGLGGVDCGPFGGPVPYRLSGVYDRPLIYQLNMPVEVPVGQNMNVNVRVKTINDGN